MKTLTPQQIVALKPCEGYDLEQVTELFDNKKSVTYLEILNTDKIPPIDIVWLFCQPEVLDRDIIDQWLDIIVTRAVTNHALHCGIEKVEKWAKNWLNGDDRTYDSARSARTAARYAHNAAGYAACIAGNAAHAAAYVAIYAAYDAIFVAAIYSATYVACKTEHKQQIQDLKEILSQYVG